MSQAPRSAGARQLLALLLIVVSPAALGCAVKIPVVSLYEGPESSPSPARTGVVPFADERPELQHEGQKPWLIPLIFFNWRRSADHRFRSRWADRLRGGHCHLNAGGQRNGAAHLPMATGRV